MCLSAFIVCDCVSSMYIMVTQIYTVIMHTCTCMHINNETIFVDTLLHWGQVKVYKGIHISEVY